MGKKSLAGLMRKQIEIRRFSRRISETVDKTNGFWQFDESFRQRACAFPFLQKVARIQRRGALVALHGCLRDGWRSGGSRGGEFVGVAAANCGGEEQNEA